MTGGGGSVPSPLGDVVGVSPELGESCVDRGISGNRSGFLSTDTQAMETKVTC